MGSPVDDALDRLLDCERQHWAPDPNRQQIAQEFDAALAAVRSELERHREERDAANERAKKLNRRATQAEAVVTQTVEDCRRQGVSVGRALANSACSAYEARAEAAEAEVQRLTELNARERKARKAAEELNADAVVAARTNLEAQLESERVEVRRLTEGLREQGEPIMDERFRDRLLRHVLSNEEVSQLVDAIESREARARALLSASPSDGTWENPGPEGLIEEHRPAPGFGPDGGGAK